METITIVGFLLITSNLLVSYQGLRSPSFFERYEFNVENILLGKQYYRLITAGFLHVNWLHLLFNMFSFYFFGATLEYIVGPMGFLLLYFISLISGNLLALFINRAIGEYSAVGASGAVCGVIFASIALIPGLELRLLFFPEYIPAWIYGIAYLLFSMYGIKKRLGNIGHDAHLGGAFTGVLLAVLLVPQMASANMPVVALIVIPVTLFLLYIIVRPSYLLTPDIFGREVKLSKDERYNAEKTRKQKELDRLLDKISRVGLNGLSKKERERLDALANE